MGSKEEGKQGGKYESAHSKKSKERDYDKGKREKRKGKKKNRRVSGNESSFSSAKERCLKQLNLPE